jgi:hypothetical protein
VNESNSKSKSKNEEYSSDTNTVEDKVKKSASKKSNSLVDPD